MGSPFGMSLRLLLRLLLERQSTFWWALKTPFFPQASQAQSMQWPQPQKPQQRYQRAKGAPIG